MYVLITYVNAQGESTPSGPGVLVNTMLNDAVQLTLPVLASLPGWIQGLGPSYIPTGFNVYEADVATGSAAPATQSYQLVSAAAFGATVTIGSTASGAAPPESCTARITPGGLQPPPTPTVERVSGAGSFPAGRDVYVIATATNASGETLPSLAGVLVNTVLDDAVQVPIPSTQYLITGVNLYEADVPTGNPAPATTAYALVGSFQPNTTATITATAAWSSSSNRQHIGTARKHCARYSQISTIPEPRDIDTLPLLSRIEMATYRVLSRHSRL